MFCFVFSCKRKGVEKLNQREPPNNGGVTGGEKDKFLDIFACCYKWVAGKHSCMACLKYHIHILYDLEVYPLVYRFNEISLCLRQSCNLLWDAIHLVIEPDLLCCSTACSDQHVFWIAWTVRYPEELNLINTRLYNW